jgi:hypothetical protein
MPIDRTPQNTLKPKLASNRTAKTPLTPRLAVAPSTAPASTPQLGRHDRGTPATTPRANSTVYGDVTPVKAFISSNVTPRSSSRKSRVGFESASSTPSGTPISTPTSSRPPSSIDFSQREQGIGYAGGGLNGNNGVRPRSTPGLNSAQATPTPRLPLANIYNTGPSEAAPAKATSPLFFHASEARPPQEQLPFLKKAPTFYYADGKQDDTPKKYEVSAPPRSTTERATSGSNFFHADTISEAKGRSPNPTPSPLSTSPEPLDRDTGHGATFRQPSPTKEWAHLSYRKGASQVMRPSMASRTSGLSALSGPGAPDVPDRSSRRSSVASYAMRGGHGKSASMSSIDSVADLKTSNEPSAMPPSPLNTDNRVLNNGALADSMTSASPSPMPAVSALPSPVPTSPTKQSGEKSVLEAMNELAANARRERKVLDLEISNSSLLAINRGLEKEVRKQKAELRRFRRMSRAGRFAMDPAGSSETTSIPGASHIGDLSDMSEEEESSELPPEDDDAASSSDSFDESQLSPSAQLERDETYRFGDEKRLQLDLSKHRDLLMDSQKMNQSLKRCMNWTEQLIKDGQKALEYQVRPSDVKLGGRVLVVEDDEHEAAQAEESRGLLSPWSPLHRDVDALDSPFFTNAVERIVDRDSGVDVDGLESLLVPDSVASLGSPFEERIQRLQASIEALGAS